MIEYIESINEKIIKLSEEINNEAERKIKSATSKDEANKIKYISIYYRTVLQGAKYFSMDALRKKRDIEENSSGIELEENPKININVAEVSPDIDFSKKESGIPDDLINVEVSELSEPFEIDENVFDRIKKEAAKRRERITAKILESKKEDIFFEDQEDVPIKMEVSEVSLDIDDVALDENPDIKVDVAEVSADIGDIELEENPQIDIEVSEVTPDIDDIALDENPEIKIDVAEVSKDNLDDEEI